MPNCPNNCISTEHCAQLSNTDKIICAIDKSTQKNIENLHESHVNATCIINSNSAQRDEKREKYCHVFSLLGLNRSQLTVCLLAPENSSLSLDLRIWVLLAAGEECLCLLCSLGTRDTAHCFSHEVVRSNDDDDAQWWRDTGTVSRLPLMTT